MALAGVSQKMTPTNAATSNSVPTKRTLGEAKKRDIRIFTLSQFPSSHNGAGGSGPDDHSLCPVLASSKAGDIVRGSQYIYQNLTD